MKLIFERSIPGHGQTLLPHCDVPEITLDAPGRETPLHLAELSENDLSRHFTELSKQVHGVNCGFYPLGSCTMKYSPKLDEDMAALPGFTDIHPLQPAHTAQGCLHVLHEAAQQLCVITGMDEMTMQPAAGAHGEFTGLLLIKSYHRSRGDDKRTKIIVPDSAHGTNPASASMAGFTIVNVPSRADGCVDLEKLKAAVGDDTAGLMLTNPNTVGLFDKNILEITKIIHDAGGLNYYDGANLNAVMGIVRPGDMGFDVVHVNLHKTFATPHGGGGPGSGPVGCKAFLADFLPGQVVRCADGVYTLSTPEKSIGCVRGFHGNFLVAVKALTYLMMLGREGVPEAARNAVLNANYLMHRIKGSYPPAVDGICMHEFVASMDKAKHEFGVSATDVAKAMLDYGIHPPTMYFPLIVHEALMFEPTETESKATLDETADILLEIMERAKSDPDSLHAAPLTAPIGRPDEVTAARQPVTRYVFEQ